MFSIFYLILPFLTVYTLILLYLKKQAIKQFKTDLNLNFITQYYINFFFYIYNVYYVNSIT